MAWAEGSSEDVVAEDIRQWDLARKKAKGDYYQTEAAKSGFTDPYAADTRSKWLAEYGAPGHSAPQVSAPDMGKASTYGGASFAGAKLDTSAENATKDYQNTALSGLSDMATGKAPSLAEMQMKAGLNANLKSQLAMAATKGGGNASLLLRNLGSQASQANMLTAQQAAMAKVAERQSALAGLGGLAGGVRAQDQASALNQAKLSQEAALANASFQQQAGLFNAGAANDWEKYRAGLGLQAGMANQSATLGAMGLNDAQKRWALGGLTTKGEMDRDAMMKFYGMNNDFDIRRAGLGLEREKAETAQANVESDRFAKYMSGFAQAIAMGAASDEKSKNMKKDADAGQIAQAFASGAAIASGESPSAPWTGAMRGAASGLSGPSSAKKMTDMQAALAAGAGASRAQHAAEPPGPYSQLISKDFREPGEMGYDPYMASHRLQATGVPFVKPGGWDNDPQKYSGFEGLQGSDLGDLGDENASVETMPGYAPAGSTPAAGTPMYAPVWKSSDEKVKNMKGGGDPEMDHFLDSIQAHAYTYKDPEKPGRGPGMYVSPTAQEFEKSPLSKGAVEDTPNGKMVDYGKLMGVNFAAVADLHDRLSNVEKMLASKKKRASGG